MSKVSERSSWALSQEGKESAESDSTSMKEEIFCVQRRALGNYIADNLLSADLKWGLFCAASNSYRFDSVLKPFPPLFLLQDDVKQIERLREVIELCPSMSDVLKQLKDNSLPSVLQDLLYWVLIHSNEPSFKYIAKEEHQGILSQVSSEIPAAVPDYIFSVTYNKKNHQKFLHNAVSYSTKFAFHGSRLDNFYSITNYGLNVSFNKVAAYGPGIYLSNEILFSLPYSPRGFTWPCSYFGSHIGIVALCEVINHPDVRSEHESGVDDFLNFLERNIFDVCDNKSVPGKYLIVENSDLVCIRYLLIFSSDEFESASLMQSHTLLGWLKRHRMLVFVVGYIILLLGIGSSNSSLLYKYYKRLLRRFEYNSR